METKQKYLRDIRDAINGVETSMSGVAGESEATYLRDIAKAIRSSGIDPSIPKVTDADNGKILKVINGVWAKGESSSGVLYGEETPASSLGKDGDVYVQYEVKENKSLKYFLDTPIVITDYSDSNQMDAACIFTGITLENGKNYLLEAGVDVVDSESYANTYGWTHVDGSRLVTFGPDTRGMGLALTSVTPPDCAGARYVGDRNAIIAAAGSYAYSPHEGELAIDFGNKFNIKTLLHYGKHGEYSRTVTNVNVYEVEYETSLTDIYLKVDGEWVKDGFGKDKEPEQPESISLLHFDEDFVNDQITDAKGITYSIVPAGSTGIDMSSIFMKFGEESLSMSGNGWVNSEILGDKLDFKNGDFTIDLWVRPSDTWRMCPICLPGNGLLIDLEGGKARIWFVDEENQLVVHADGGGNGFGTIPVPPNVWTHIAYVREGNYVALFVNGKLDIYVYIGSINKQYIPGSSGIRLGNWDNGDSALYTYAGYIDEVRVTNKAMWHIFDNYPTEPYTK